MWHDISLEVRFQEDPLQNLQSDEFYIAIGFYNHMGVANVEVMVTFPTGETAPGSTITIFSRSEIYQDSKQWSATSDGSGKYVWPNMNTGLLGNVYEFAAKYVDPENGNIWLGEAVIRVKRSLTVKINLRKAYLNEITRTQLDISTIEFLSNLEEGDAFIDVLRELSTSLALELSRSAIALSAYLVEGFIRVKLKLDEEWQAKFERRTLGQLLEESAVKQALGNKVYRKALLLNESKVLALHPVGTRSIIEEAYIGVQLMKDIADSWFNGLNKDDVNKVNKRKSEERDSAKSAEKKSELNTDSGENIEEAG